MLNGVPANIGPDLLKVLSEMGHGDELVIADGNFPSAALAKRAYAVLATGEREVYANIIVKKGVVRSV